MWIETKDRGLRLNWYRCTRHTFASAWTAKGGTPEQLKEIMGHSTFNVTLRYAHLVPGAFSEADRSRITFDFSPADGKVVALRPAANEGQMRDAGGKGRKRVAAGRLPGTGVR